jgi:hypothetical protein
MTPLLPDRLRPFAVRAAIAALLSVAAASLLRAPWGAVFRLAAILAAERVGAASRIAFEPVPSASLFAPDTGALLFAPGGAGHVRIELSSIRFGFVPIAVYAGLAWAARSTRRSAGPLAAGAMAVVVWVPLSVGLSLAHVALHEPWLGVVAPPSVAGALELAYRVLVNPPAFEYALPAFVWLAAAALSTGRAAGASATR